MVGCIVLVNKCTHQGNSYADNNLSPVRLGHYTHMLRAAYHDAQGELLVDGHREDYEQLRDTVCLALTSRSEVTLPVQNTGDTAISHFVVRSSTPPNRISYERGRVVFSVAPSLQEQFLSFIEFPADTDLPDSPVQYHHHYDGLADGGTYVAPDSLSVIFGLEGV